LVTDQGRPWGGLLTMFCRMGHRIPSTGRVTTITDRSPKGRGVHLVGRILGFLGKGKCGREHRQQAPPQPVPPDLEDALEAINDGLNHSSDLVVKRFTLGGRKGTRLAVLYLEGMADASMVQDSVIEPLMLWARPVFTGSLGAKAIVRHLQSSLCPAQEMRELHSLGEVLTQMLEGDSVILIHGSRVALGAQSKGFPKRGVESPETDVVIRGSREAFNECIRDNVAMIRKRLKTPGLVVDQWKLGRKSQTGIRVMYLSGVAHPKTVQEVQYRVKSIDIDAIHDSGAIQSLISDHPFSLFPTVRASERPDVVAAALVEGRVAILVDNSPFALIMPALFFEFFSTAEDFTGTFNVTLVLRVIRVTAFFFSTLMTPFYVGIATFHHELIPLPLLLNIAVTQSAVPFPLGVTAFAIEIVLEVLREAGVRLPRQVGQAVSIVGAIVLGQAAVQAGFAPPALVIVTALGTIASFAIPGFEGAIALRMLRFPLLLLASVMGLYGLSLGTVLIIFHLASLESFGIPFLSYPTAIIRDFHPLTRRRQRPFGKGDRTRQRVLATWRSRQAGDHGGQQ